jgi:hypothetical protein
MAETTLRTAVEHARIAERAEQIADLLPGVLRRTRAPARDDLLSALLGEMASMLLGREQVLDALDAFYDPESAPPASLLFLAYWVDLEPLVAAGQPPGLGWLRREDWPEIVREGFPSGVERLRALVASAAGLIRRRGTPQGLQRFLETATGVPGFAVVESAEQPFHIYVDCPAEAQPFRAFVERIIEYQKPAYLTCELREQAATESK